MYALNSSKLIPLLASVSESARSSSGVGASLSSSSSSSSSARDGGISTWSITWMIPLDAATSGVVTVASPIITLSVTVKVALSPLTIVTESPSVTSLEAT